MKTKRMKRTPKQSVLKKRPEAFCQWSSLYGCFFVNNGRSDLHIGVGNTAQQAWADTAKSLK